MIQNDWPNYVKTTFDNHNQDYIHIPGHGFQSKSYPLVILSDNEQFSIDRGFVSQV